MMGMMKTSKTLGGKAEEEMIPFIVKHDKMVKRAAFWSTFIFCIFFSWFCGALIVLCKWGMDWGPAFDAWWELKGKKSAPGGEALDAVADGDFEEAAGHVGDDIAGSSSCNFGDDALS